MMEYWYLKLLFQLLFLFLKTSSFEYHEIDLTCNFNVKKLDFCLEQPLNTCVINDNPNIIDDDFKIRSLQSEKTENKILEFFIEGKVFEYFPTNFQDKFSNLIAITVRNSGLRKIINENFNKLTNLKCLQFYNNKLEKLEQGIFDNNKMLEKLIFGTNQFHYIHPDVFNHLTNLNFLGLRNNTCIDQAAKGSNFEKILNKIIEAIKVNCSSITQSYLIDVRELKDKFNRIKRKLKFNDAELQEINQNLISFNTSLKNLFEVPKIISETMNKVEKSINDKFEEVSGELISNLNNISSNFKSNVKKVNEDVEKFINQSNFITGEVKNLTTAIEELTKNVKKFNDRNSNKESDEKITNSIQNAESMEYILIIVNLCQLFLIILISFLSLFIFFKSHSKQKVEIEEIYLPSNVSNFDPNYSNFENAGRINENQLRDLSIYDDLQNVQDEANSYEKLENFKSLKSLAINNGQEIKIINVEESQYGEIWKENDCIGDPIYSEVNKSKKSLK